MLIDCMVEPVAQDNMVGICCMCGQELYSVDTVIVHDGELYCDYDCLRPEIGTFETEAIESTNCSFCGEPIYKGEDIVSNVDGSVFCDTICVFGGHDIEEVYGYDLHALCAD